jgi:ribosomal protein L39E
MRRVRRQRAAAVARAEAGIRLTLTVFVVVGVLFAVSCFASVVLFASRDIRFAKKKKKNAPVWIRFETTADVSVRAERHRRHEDAHDRLDSHAVASILSIVF